MRGWWTGIGAIGLVVGLLSAPVRAGDAGGATAAPNHPTEQACLAACGRLIDRCTGVFGPAMGDMRPFCSEAVVRRCRTGGLRVCEIVADEGAGS